MEAMRHEENVRVNADRDRIRSLAPDKWEEFKQAFIDECASVSAESKTVRLEWDDRPGEEFWILRTWLSRPSTTSIAALCFTFNRSIPHIRWQDYLNKKLPRVIDFAIDGNDILFVEGGRGLILSRFVEACLDAVTQ